MNELFGSKILLESITELAAKLNMKSIAEGFEQRYLITARQQSAEVVTGWGWGVTRLGSSMMQLCLAHALTGPRRSSAFRTEMSKLLNSTDIPLAWFSVGEKSVLKHRYF